MLVGTLLALSIVGAVTGAAPAEPAKDEAAPAPAVTYDEAVAQMEELLPKVHNAKKKRKFIDELQRVRQQVESFEEELRADAISDGEGWFRLKELRVDLAVALLENKQKEEAQAVVDELLRLPPEADVDFAGHPNIEALYQERQLALETAGKGRISVLCHEGCVVRIGGQPLPRTDFELYLGRYEVEIIPTVEGKTPPKTYTVELTETGQKEELVFGQPPAEVCDSTQDEDGDGAVDCDDSDCEKDPACYVPPEVCDNKGADDDGDGKADCDDTDCISHPACRMDEVCDNGGVDDDKDGKADCDDSDCFSDAACFVPPPKRLLPLWAEIGGIVAGVGMATAGGAMLTYDGKCEDRDLPLTDCPKVWESTAGGASLLAIGATVAVTATVFLIIDHKRMGNSGASDGTKDDGGGKKGKRRARFTPTGALRF